MTNWPHLYSGKVRDLYGVDDELMLMVASDRMSAYDVVMHEPIVHKGRVLTAFTQYWSERLEPEVATALVSCDPVEIERHAPGFAEVPEWHGRTMLVRRATMVPLECIVRGRLAGQAYDEYRVAQTVHGVPYPPGLRLTDPFESPQFTPSTKAETGHDRNIDLVEAAKIVGEETLERARAMCVAIFSRAAHELAEVGLTLADTKFELGWVDGELVLCDEVLTPDSSRIWPTEMVVAGQVPPAYDKQPFRDWLSSVGWDRVPPPPTVPAEVAAETSARYVAAYELVTGRSLRDWYGA